MMTIDEIDARDSSTIYAGKMLDVLSDDEVEVVAHSTTTKLNEAFKRRNLPFVAGEGVDDHSMGKNVLSLVNIYREGKHHLGIPSFVVTLEDTPTIGTRKYALFAYEDEWKRCFDPCARHLAITKAIGEITTLVEETRLFEGQEER
jgi:hypothetical protein